MRIDSPPEDSLSISLEVREEPLAKGPAGLNAFFDALEAHAVEWLPERIDSFKGARYSRTAVLKRFDQQVRKGKELGATLLRASPFTRLSLAFYKHVPHCRFSVYGCIYPLALMEEPARAKRWSAQFIKLMRAWGASYAVTHAYVHATSDEFLAHDVDVRRAHLKVRPGDLPEQAPREWLRAIFWLNVLGKEWVDALGRDRVLSTPAHLVEELPNGAVLIVTRPSLANWRSDEARQAQARAFVHLRPELDFDTVLRTLRERSSLLEPVEPRFDPDIAPLLQRIVNEQFSIQHRPRQIAEFNAYRPPEVEEWLPASASLPSDVPNPAGAIDTYQELADVLSVMLRPDVEDYFKAPPEALTEIDYRLWWEKFPEFYEREKIDGRLFPSVGAYLGYMLVRHLGGRWVPRKNLLESQVIVGDRAWLPFLRTQRYLQSTPSLLDYSLTKFYRAAERYHAGQRAKQPSGES